MKLPFSLTKKPTSQYFLALLLRENRAAAVIFEELNGKVRVVGEHEEFFLDSLDTASDEEILEVLDKTISKAENNLPPEIETQKTIFGVPEDWVQDARIKKSYLLKLKKLCGALGLDPIGFLVLTEAISHLLQKEEGAPLTALLVEVTPKEVALTLVKAGKIIETKKAPLEETASVTADKLLHHFQSEILPNRIILINGVESSLGRDKKYDELIQEFTKHTWSKSLPFLHVPQITTLPHGFDAKAVLFGAASQMGFEVLDNELPTPKEIEKEVHIPIEERLEEMQGEGQEKHESIKPDESFGFVTNQDIAFLSHNVEKPSLEKPEEEPYEKDTHQPTHAQSISHPPSSQRHTRSFSLPLLFGTTKGFMGIISRSITTFMPSGSSKKLYIILPIVAALLVGIVVLYISQVKADVTIRVKPESAQKEHEVSFALNQPSDFSAHTISAKTMDINESTTITTDATGEKEVGEKAKGTITILSSLTKEQNLPEGTTVTSSNGLTFLLDKPVKIASSSGLTDIKSSQASIIAKDIGKEYNLPSGTKFSIQSFDKSSVEAKNDSAFSGGSKQEVTVVDKADIDKLLAELPKNTDEKAKQDSKAKITNDEEMFPDFVDTSVTKKEFDKKAGEEAKAVTLTGTVTYQLGVYKKKDLEEYAKQLLGDSIQNRTITDNGLEVILEKIEKKDEIVTAQLSARASLIPKINTGDVAKQIQGKSFDEAKTTIAQMQQVESVDIVLAPNFSFLPKILPRFSKNITVHLTNNE